MNINERMHAESSLRRSYLILENQKTMLETLVLAAQQLWSDDEVRARCDQLLREVAREAVKNSREIMDLSDRLTSGDAVRVPEASGGSPDDLPF